MDTKDLGLRCLFPAQSNKIIYRRLHGSSAESEGCFCGHPERNDLYARRCMCSPLLPYEQFHPLDQKLTSVQFKYNSMSPMYHS